jgi:hypothetical protein
MQSYTICPETFLLNFVLYEDDSFYHELNWRENPDNVRVTVNNEDTFELIDTTGLTAIMEIRLKSDLTLAPVLTLTESSGITFAGDVSPNIIINISKVNILAIGPGVFSYDMICTNSAGQRFTLLKGDITIKSNITELT